MRALLLAALFLGTLSFVPPAEAQVGVVPNYELRFDVPQAFIDRVPGQAMIRGTLYDRSSDPGGDILPPVVQPNLLPHQVNARIEVETEDIGWQVLAPFLPSTIYAGQEVPVEVPVFVRAQASTALYKFRLVVNVTNPDGTTQELSAQLSAYSPGNENPTVLGGGSREVLRPGRVYGTHFTITNIATVPRTFVSEVADNPCGFGVADPGTMVVPAKSSETFTVQYRVTEERLWYFFGDQCTVSLRVSPIDNPNQQRTIFFGGTVLGPNIQPPFVMGLLSAALALTLLFLFVKRRKERIEEELLGKPQKPWTIPVERVYLDQLKREDPRAWYIVRHYLMEDEYRSALGWYKSYKHATRADRKKERLILREERRYGRWRDDWQRRVAQPMRQADRKEARLLRKLERKAARRHKAALRKHAENVSAQQAAHEKRQQRALEKWEKAVRRAEKKGQPAPPQPVPEPLELLPEPAPPVVRLEGSRYETRAQRIRRRATRRQGDLEVRFEKADARRRERMETKVERLSRDVHDERFLREHGVHREGPSPGTQRPG